MKNLLLIFAFIFAASFNVAAQNTAPAEKKTVIFKTPDGFMPAKMPPNRKGITMLNPNAPAGMFVAYTPDEMTSADYLIELRKMYGGYFDGTQGADHVWQEAGLPAHEKVQDETGKMFTATSGDKELQVVAYVRTIAPGQDVVYGYFAMKDTKSKKNSAAFIDQEGKGVKEFDKLWKTIGVQK
jgi:hypothetical protein